LTKDRSSITFRLFSRKIPVHAKGLSGGVTEILRRFNPRNEGRIRGDKPASCIKQARREHFQSLVMRVLLESNRLGRMLPRVKSSKGGGTWCLASKGSATSLSQRPRRVCFGDVCNVKVNKCKNLQWLALFPTRHARNARFIGGGIVT